MSKNWQKLKVKSHDFGGGGLVLQLLFQISKLTKCYSFWFSYCCCAEPKIDKIWKSHIFLGDAGFPTFVPQSKTRNKSCIAPPSPPPAPPPPQKIGPRFCQFGVRKLEKLTIVKIMELRDFVESKTDKKSFKSYIFATLGVILFSICKTSGGSLLWNNKFWHISLASYDYVHHLFAETNKMARENTIRRSSEGRIVIHPFSPLSGLSYCNPILQNVSIETQANWIVFLFITNPICGIVTTIRNTKFVCQQFLLRVEWVSCCNIYEMTSLDRYTECLSSL